MGSCPFFFHYCTYVPRVCRVIPFPILLVRVSYHTVFSCDNNSVFITLDSEQQQLFRWDVSKTATSPASMITAVYSYKWRVFFGGGVLILPFFFSLLYVRTSCASRHPVSYIVSACLVSYCLLVRQQQRFHHPTLRTTSVVLVGCIKKSNITSKHDHCCILVHVRKKSYLVYCTR